MRKIGLFNIGRLGLVKSAGTGKTDINKMIEKWIPKHMVFLYDMSKPVDVYTQNFNDWQNYNPNSVSITNNKIVVNGLIDNFRIASIEKETESFSVFIEGLGDKNLVYRVKLDENSDQITNIKLKDGKNVLPHSFATTVTFMGASGVTDYIGLTITQLPSGQSVSTNEILKANPYLQDFSGNNRPLKLNNFLFAAMSGVGGYELNWTDQSIWSRLLGSRFNGAIEPHKITVTSALGSYNIMETKVPSYAKKFKVRIDGIVDETVAYKYINASGTLVSFDIKEDGEYELPSNNTVEGNYNMGWAILVNSYPHTCNITIEQIPSYPNALVTDGVDDYGQVQNLQQGVKVLFVTINPFIDGKFIYDQRLNTTEPWLFAVFNDKGSIAYNSRNSNGKTYIDGTLNESTIVSALLNKKQIITIVNNDVTGDKTKTPVFFSNTDHNSGWISSAFYNSIGFDSVPTKETDGFTEQDLIDYYIPKAIVTITVVDVSGSPIQDATVTVGGVQYKTLSDGTVKVRGMANGTMSLSVKKDGYMPFSNNSWKLADSRITLEVLRNTVITENGYSILLENNGLILTE
jgi:hypothetical protein